MRSLTILVTLSYVASVGWADGPRCRALLVAQTRLLKDSANLHFNHKALFSLTAYLALPDKMRDDIVEAGLRRQGVRFEVKRKWSWRKLLSGSKFVQINREGDHPLNRLASRLPSWQRMIYDREYLDLWPGTSAAYGDNGTIYLSHLTALLSQVDSTVLHERSHARDSQIEADGDARTLNGLRLLKGEPPVDASFMKDIESYSHRMRLDELRATRISYKSYLHYYQAHREEGSALALGVVNLFKRYLVMLHLSERTVALEKQFLLEGPGDSDRFVFEMGPQGSRRYKSEHEHSFYSTLIPAAFVQGWLKGLSPDYIESYWNILVLSWLDAQQIELRHLVDRALAKDYQTILEIGQSEAEGSKLLPSELERLEEIKKELYELLLLSQE